MSKKNKVNVLFIMTDQQRFDTFSHNNSEIKTPNLDQLIENSVYFENARCSNPSCVPSRAAIMSGKFSSRCRCPQFVTCLDKDEKTFMKRLQEGGYYTCVVGKQHFNGSLIDKGYDEEYIVDGHSSIYPDDTIELYLDYLKENNIDRNNLYKENSISGGTFIGNSKYHIDNFIGDFGKDWLNKHLDKIDKKKEEKPWFFTLSFPGPHHPYDGFGTKYDKLYDINEMSLSSTNSEDLKDKPKQFSEMKSYSNIYLDNFSKEQFKQSKLAYYANISLIDEKIGDVINLLKDRGEYDNTLIIYTSDHGDFMGDYGLVEKLQCLSDSLMRVPLFIKPPIKDFKYKKVENDVLNIDIASTILKQSGLPIPKEIENYYYNGYWDDSIKIKTRPYIYMEAGSIIGVINNNVKTVHYLDREYGELYDLSKDPLERINLWENESYKDNKLNSFDILLNNIYRAVPKWDIPWNYGTPEI